MFSPQPVRQISRHINPTDSHHDRRPADPERQPYQVTERIAAQPAGEFRQLQSDQNEKQTVNKNSTISQTGYTLDATR